MLIRPEDSNGVLNGVAWLRFCSKDHDCGNQKAVTLKCPVQRHGECFGDFFASYNACDSLPSELLSPNDYCGADRLNSLDWRTANLKSTSVPAAHCDPSLNAFGEKWDTAKNAQADGKGALGAARTSQDKKRRKERILTRFFLVTSPVKNLQNWHIYLHRFTSCVE
jgi:hypothetical protein